MSGDGAGWLAAQTAIDIRHLLWRRNLSVSCFYVPRLPILRC